jgi:hypothetical protein
MSRDDGDPGDRRASRATPPPIGVLLKTQAKPQFDRAVDRAVEALFCVFSAPNHVESALSLPVAFNLY